MSDKRKELYAGICLLIVAVLYMFFSYGIVQTVHGLGPRTMPHMIGCGLIILSILWIVESSISLRKGELKTKEKKQGNQSNYVRVVLTFLLISGFAALLKPVGFSLSAFGYLLCQITLLTPGDRFKGRNIVKNTAIAMVAAFVLTLVFSHGLGVPLPRGSWFI